MLRFSILLLIISACGKDDNTTPSASAAFDGSLLAGNWASECTKINDSVAARGFRTFTDSTYVLDVVLYTGTECINSYEVTRTTGTRAYGNIVANLDATYEVVDVVTKVEVKWTAVSGDLLNQINQAKMYDYSDWSKDNFKDVTGRTRQGGEESEAASGKICYNILKFKDNKLYGGDLDSGDCSTPEKRPTRINTTVVFTKQ